MGPRRRRRGRGGRRFCGPVAGSVRFNGATSSSTWKVGHGAPIPSSGWALQWGHVVVDVEGQMPRSARKGRRPASMGPRRRRRGRRSLRGQIGNARGRASMGPRRRRRGRAPPACHGACGGRSFNGATSSSTWKARHRRGRARRSTELQWGHVVVDVEGPRHSCRTTSMMQASMGPRRRRRGR